MSHIPIINYFVVLNCSAICEYFITQNAKQEILENGSGGYTSIKDKKNVKKTSD